MARNPRVDFDMLKVYFGEPYVIDLDGIPGKVTVFQPTIGDIITIGEEKFYQTLNIFVTNTTQWRLPLWEKKIDWNIFTDFELFIMLYKQIDPDVAKLMFGDLDFREFEPMIKQANQEDGKDELILWNNKDQIEINYDVYNHFCQYLRIVFNIFPEEKITQTDVLKQWYINKDKRAIENSKKQQKPKTAGMQPIISACVNHPGFKYKLKELKEVGVFEFYDSVNRLQIYEQATALMKGMYSGFIDSKSIKPEDYNFMRDIIRDTNNSVSKASSLKEQG